MAQLRERARRGETVDGVWLNLGSTITAEMAALAGFDWVLIDGEHGFSDYASILRQLQATARTPAAPIVRVPWNDQAFVKRVLDAGPAGIMIPMVNTAAEAEAASRAMQYPPDGARGLAKMTRASAYGANFDAYFADEAPNLLLAVQIETPEAVENVEAIAAVDRVDVLFVGPTDLSANMGLLDKQSDPRFVASLRRVVDAARRHGKGAGILASGMEKLREFESLGFNFVAAGSDGSLVAAALRGMAKQMKQRG